MTDESLAFASAWEVRELISKKEIAPVELTELFLRRIEALNPRLNAYLTVAAEEALASARAAEKAVLNGGPQGALHGVPISVKDLELTKGLRSTAGSLIFKGLVPDHDSVVVERVRKAGAIILGKTNTPEFGMSGTNENRLGDACRNPWNPERTTGGSSGGAAAALAAGLCSLATGTDGGGSVRVPSAYCGVYGIKPTQGRVPRYGGHGRRPAMNQLVQPGPMARTVKDAAMLLQVLAGPDPQDPTVLRAAPPDFVAALEQDVGGLRMAWSPDLGYAAVDPQVAAIAWEGAQVYRELGCTVEESSIAVEHPLEPWLTIWTANFSVSHDHLLEEHAGELTSYGRDALERGRRSSGSDYSLALLAAARMKAHMDGLFERYDLLLTPALAVPAFPIEQWPAVIDGRDVDPFWGHTPFTHTFNLTGHPAASIPCGFSSDGLPIGLNIVGRIGDEVTVLQASAAFERAKPWAQLRPPVS